MHWFKRYQLSPRWACNCCIQHSKRVLCNIDSRFLIVYSNEIISAYVLYASHFFFWYVKRIVFCFCPGNAAVSIVQISFNGRYNLGGGGGNLGALACCCCYSNSSLQLTLHAFAIEFIVHLNVFFFCWLGCVCLYVYVFVFVCVVLCESNREQKNKFKALP